MKTFKYFLLFITLCCWLAFGYFLVDSIIFLQKSDTASGKVVGFISESSFDTDAETAASYRPIIEFQTTSGKTISFSSGIGSDPPSYELHETVPVLFDPSSPQNAKINGFFSFWLLPSIFATIGIITLLGGVAMHAAEKLFKKLMTS